MHIHYFDPYQSRSSLVHEMDARVKLVLALAFILTTGLTPVGAWHIYILLWATVLSVGILSRLGLSTILRKAVLALPFVLAAVPILFTVPGPALINFSIAGIHIALTYSGLERFISIALKSWLSIQAAVILTASTPFPDLLAALRAVRVPQLIVAMIALMWRYLFVLADEALRLMRAREARSGGSEDSTRRSGGKLTWRARVTGSMVGVLFMRSFERSDRIYMAMLARGFDGETRTLPLQPIQRSQWIALWLGLGLLIFLLSLAIFF